MMRSKLFVPASRPELFEKALAGAADAISFDLEDAVEPSRKAQARALLVEAMRPRARDHGKLLIVRVNGADSEHFAPDLAAAVQAGMDMVNLPKVEQTDVVREAAARLEELEREVPARCRTGLLINVETPRGLRLAAELAGADARVTGLQIGFGDLFSGLGIG